ncbi:hypothetical protein ACH4VR_40545 [Streptomyces sp. NPDC020883]|uniref:hypothetical protein n=1 Tax=Streptomyces sp. NPDC020883 TaxID=3365099 RepID=UPI003791EDDF
MNLTIGLIVTSRTTRRLLAPALGAAVATGALAWLALSAGASSAAEPASPAADTGLRSAVEDFNYPGADKILAEKNIVLKRGDGHITYVDCASGTGFLEVMSREHEETMCFKVTGSSGWLTMEIPSVHAIKGNDYTTEANMTVGSETKSFDITKNTWTGVGESGDKQRREYVLVELRATK